MGSLGKVSFSMLILFTLISISLILTPYPNNLVVYGEDDLYTSNIQGEGTSNNPFLIDGSDLDLISLEDLGGYFEIDCEGTGPDIDLKDIDKVRIKDFVSSENTEISIENCGMVILDNIHLSGMDFDLSSSGVTIIGGSYVRCSLDMMAWSGSVYANSTYTNSTLHVSLGDTVSVYNNIFMNSTLWMERPKTMTIYDNEFIGERSGIEAEGDTNPYLPFSDLIYNNTFESCTKGFTIKTMAMTEHFYEFDIFDNYFGNCTNAIYLNFATAFGTRVWRNTFFHNGGTGDSGTGTQVHLNIRSGDITWYNNGIGNCWWHHRTPDVDQNSIVDNSLDLQNAVPTPAMMDLFPLTDRFAYAFRPNIKITSPKPIEKCQSELTFKWKVTDLRFNITSVELSVDSGDWIDVTGRSSYTADLEYGPHTLIIRAENEMGLKNSSSVSFYTTYDPSLFWFISPSEEEIVTTDPVTISWGIDSSISPKRIDLLLDDLEFNVDLSSRDLDLSIPDGTHTATLKVWDHYDLFGTKELTFSVDRTLPIINIISPQNSSILSNIYVPLLWEVQDNIGVNSTKYRLDGGNWMLQNDPISMEMYILYDAGYHRIDIQTRDLAGWRNSTSIHFTIGDEMKDLIISPMNGTHTIAGDITIEWRVPESFDPIKGKLMVKENAKTFNITDLDQYEVRLPQDGKYSMKVRFTDQVGNYLEQSVIIVRDRGLPQADFEFREQLYNYTSPTIRWYANDDHCEPTTVYSLDKVEWTDIGTQKYINLQNLEEGTYNLYLRIQDKAKNQITISTSFTVDTTPPELSVIGPLNEGSIEGPFIDIQWYVSDKNSIENVTIVMDRRTLLFFKSGYRSYDLSSGSHSLTIMAWDRALNLAVWRSKFTIDNFDPEISWIREPLTMNSNGMMEISWVIEDDTWIEETRLLLNGKDGSDLILENEAQFNLEDGIWEITIWTRDPVGHEDTLSKKITIDSSPPEVVSISWEYDQDGLLISCVVMDLYSEVRSVELYLDEELVAFFNGNFSYTIQGASREGHSISIVLEDENGNKKRNDYFIPMVPEDEVVKEKENTGRLILWLMIPGVIILVVLSIFIPDILKKLRTKTKEK